MSEKMMVAENNFQLHWRRACLNLRRLLIACLCVSFGCAEPTGSNGAERTYPAAVNFQEITIEQVISEPPPAGDYNVQAFVFSVNICPEKVLCILPDGITISADDSFKNSIHLPVSQPGQFCIGAEYRMSVRLNFYDFEQEKPQVYLTLLGYDQI